MYSIAYFVEAKDEFIKVPGWNLGFDCKKTLSCLRDTVKLLRAYGGCLGVERR